MLYTVIGGGLFKKTCALTQGSCKAREYAYSGWEIQFRKHIA